MVFIDPNKIKRISRLDGLRNSQDIWSIYDELKELLLEVNLNISDLVDEQSLDNKGLACLEKVRKFCVDASQKFRDAFLELLDRYREEHRQLSQKIIDYLLEKRLDLPGFIISNGDRAREFLREYDIDSDIDRHSFLLNFQLPKPLSQFWWKGGVDSWGEWGEDVRGMVIEWGHFYRELMPVIWEIQGYYENERGLMFARINEIGMHSEQYYYLWKVFEWKKRR